MADMHDATEEYLENILEIEEEGTRVMRARLVERLGLSAAAVSETVGRLADNGYVELADDRTVSLTEQGPGAGHHGRATAPPRRATARRRDRPRVGEGAPRGRPLGARDLRRCRGQARSRCSAIPPPARTATRSPVRCTRSPMSPTLPLSTRVRRSGHRRARRRAHRDRRRRDPAHRRRRPHPGPRRHGHRHRRRRRARAHPVGRLLDPARVAEQLFVDGPARVRVSAQPPATAGTMLST